MAVPLPSTSIEVTPSGTVIFRSEHTLVKFILASELEPTRMAEDGSNVSLTATWLAGITVEITCDESVAEAL